MVAAGCGGVGDAALAEDADESVSVASTESALTAEVADEVAQPVSTTAEQLASASSKRVPTHFTPSGCVAATQEGAKVTYVLTNCTGRYGLVTVSGTVIANYSRAANGGVQVLITSSALKANKATFDVNATVVATQSGTTKSAAVTTKANGTGPRGVALTRDGSYTVSFDTASECITVNGSWQTGVGARSSTTTVANYQKCKGTCPASGGSIVHDTARGGIVTVLYDGDATAAWSTSTGRSGTFDLICSK